MTAQELLVAHLHGEVGALLAALLLLEEGEVGALLANKRSIVEYYTAKMHAEVNNPPPRRVDRKGVITTPADRNRYFYFAIDVRQRLRYLSRVGTSAR